MKPEFKMVENIGPNEQQKRLFLGLLTMLIGLILGILLIISSLGRGWGVILFIFFWLGALGYFQAKNKTCVVLAYKGICNMDIGEQEITDETLKARLRKQALEVHILSLIVAILLTTIIVVFPR